MKVSVVVPAYNEEKLLGATLDCIRKATAPLPRVEWELVVCDNNSTDRTAEIARAAGARVVFEPVNQISRARNAGASAATGDWLVFVDADSLPSAPLFSDMLFHLEKMTCVAGGATIDMDTEERLARFAVGAWNAWSRLARWAAGSFIFCRADAFRAIGGFSTELYASEEVDFSRRIKRLGPLVILHRHPLRTSGRKAKLYSWGEMSRFAFATVLTLGRNLKDRGRCFVWYDGRR